MATLKVFEVADPVCGGSNISLRRWLDGRWAILFSHPDDFVQCDLEFDRWLGITGEVFAQARVRPLALPRSSCPIDRGWISQLTGGAPVSLHDRLHGRDPTDFHACWLQDAITCVRARFAMIIDATLRPRSTHTYGVVEPPPSPLDFVRMACQLRDEQPQAPRASAWVKARVAAPGQLTCARSATA